MDERAQLQLDFNIAMEYVCQNLQWSGLQEYLTSKQGGCLSEEAYCNQQERSIFDMDPSENRGGDIAGSYIPTVNFQIELHRPVVLSLSCCVLHPSPTRSLFLICNSFSLPFPTAIPSQKLWSQVYYLSASGTGEIPAELEGLRQLTKFTVCGNELSGESYELCMCVNESRRSLHIFRHFPKPTDHFPSCCRGMFAPFPNYPF